MYIFQNLLLTQSKSIIMNSPYFVFNANAIITISIRIFVQNISQEYPLYLLPYIFVNFVGNFWFCSSLQGHRVFLFTSRSSSSMCARRSHHIDLRDPATHLTPHPLLKHVSDSILFSVSMWHLFWIRCCYPAILCF